jgi:hypothetical protein
LILVRARLSRSLPAGALVAGSVGAAVAVEAGASVAVVLPPDVLVGATALMICAGSAQLISRIARTMNTVIIFRDIPYSFQ